MSMYVFNVLVHVCITSKLTSLPAMITAVLIVQCKCRVEYTRDSEEGRLSRPLTKAPNYLDSDCFPRTPQEPPYLSHTIQAPHSHTILQSAPRPLLIQYNNTHRHPPSFSQTCGASVCLCNILQRIIYFYELAHVPFPWQG